MKSLAILLSVAVLIGVISCMSLQEYEEADESSRDLGWLHFHFHFHELEEDAVSAAQSKRLCAKSNYEVKAGNDEINFPFDGCLVVSKVGDGVSIQVEMNKKTFYTNTYENNGIDTMPCVASAEKPKRAEICPQLYDVQDKKLCAKMKQIIELKNLGIIHTIDLGCIDLL